MKKNYNLTLLLSLTILCTFACSGRKIQVIKVKSKKIVYGQIGKNTSDCLTMDKNECDVFLLVNKYREQNGLNPLLAIDNCIKAARYHSHQMQNNKSLNHNGKVESWAERISRFSAVGEHMSENIAMASTPIKAMDLWKKSEEHNTNMMNPVLTHTGVGHSNRYWTQCFIEIQK